MDESSFDPDPEVDARLNAWLREAAPGQQLDVSVHVANVRRVFLERLEIAGGTSAQAHQLRPAGRLLALSRRHRVMVGGITVGGIAALALTVPLLFVVTSHARLSAMERIIKQLGEITSYTCRATGTNTGLEDGKRVTINDDYVVSWLAPGSYYQKTKIVKALEGVAGGNRREEILEDFEEILPLGKQGVFVDHRYKTLTRILYKPTDEPIGSKAYPWEFLRLICAGSYEVLRDLGTRQAGDTNLHGYRLALKRQTSEKKLDDAIELWVDSQTDLPVDIHWSGESDGWKYSQRTTDFHWNVALEATQFEPAIRPGYTDITPPGDPKDLDQIAAALRLYAQLNGGHYPQTRKIDPIAIRDEMLRMADSATVSSEEARGKLRREIDQVMPGLDWLARSLCNRYQSGYRGLKVGPMDKDQVLVWMPHDLGYRVFYGDLRTELLTTATWSTLVPASEVVDIRKLE